MTDTIMSAKNTFSEGLVMDFAPDNTQATTLTSALNATLLTFNGNEMSLQNDMGNGRVETAYLPEGYVPVGTCEFGDIIYIVSYNPIINKSQIGCFPSPERNISSEEIQTMEQSLSWIDFQQGDEVPNGTLKRTTVKKILFQNTMNPGDKYIIYTQQGHGDILNSKNVLSDYGNTNHLHNYWPKLTKIHVVSIEESGKMVYLDSTVKWYTDINYYIQSMTKNPNNKPDLDSYRSLVSSAYSIFQSKVSGKLAILVELERINNFSSTYSVYTEKNKTRDSSNIEYTTYHIFNNISWTSNHNDINPSGVIITKSEWVNTPAYVQKYIQSSDSWILDANINNATIINLPIQSAYTGSGFDSNSVIPIHRLYQMEDPGETYEQYIQEKSYNSKIGNIVAQVRNNEEYPLISKITLFNEGLKYPVTNNNKNRLYYPNLYELDQNGKGWQLNSDGSKFESVPKEISDDVVNNYFSKDVIKYLGSIQVPSIQTITANGITSQVQLDLSNLIWNYSIAPVMPYGVLEYLKIDNTIDFSKINSGLIDLTGWRYHNSGTTSVITLSLDAYPEENKGISEVVLEFYDNQGLAAAYHISNKTSYSGTFTEYIELNSKNTNYKLNDIDRNGSKFEHKGNVDQEGEIQDENDDNIRYMNDAGVIYANALYRVLITVKYHSVDSLGNFNTSDKSEYRYFSRWYYTTEMFNDYYFSTKDFDILKPQLTLDVVGTFSDVGIEPKLDQYNVCASLSQESTYINTLGANIYSINQNKSKDATGNVNLKLNFGLEEDYGIFSLNKDRLGQLNVQVSLGNSTITKSKEPTQISETEHVKVQQIVPLTATKLNSLYQNTQYNRSGYVSYLYGDNKAQVSNTVLDLLGISSMDATGPVVGSEDLDIFDSEDAYLAYLDSFSLNFKSDLGTIYTDAPLTYLNSSSEEVTLNKYVAYEGSTALELVNSGINLTLTGVFFNKFAYGKIVLNQDIKCVKSILNQSSLKDYGMRLGTDGHLYFSEIQTIHMGESKGNDTRYGAFYTNKSNKNGWLNTYEWGTVKDGHNEWRPDLTTNGEVQNDLLPNVNNYFIPIVIGKTNSSNGEIDGIIANRAIYNTYQKYVKSSTITFDDNRKLYPGSKVISSDGSNCNSAPCVVSFLCFRDKIDGKVKITNDPFVSSCSSQGFIGSDNSTIGIYKGTTQADIVGGLYSQLYSVVNDHESLSSGDNFICLDAFSEQWNKDIIVSIKEVSSPNSLLLFYGDTLDNYCNKLINNQNFAGIDYSNDNITFDMNPVTKTITFQFSVSYDVSDIKLRNLQTSKNQVKVLQYNSSGQESPIYVTGDVVRDTLYTLDGTRIIPFSNVSTIYNIKSWEGKEKSLSPVSSGTISKSDLSSLSSLLYVSEGVLHISDMSQLKNNNNTFDIIWLGIGDNPGLCRIPGGSIFNKLKI